MILYEKYNRYIICDFKIWNLIQNQKRKLKKNPKTKFFLEKKKLQKKFIFFLEKWKKMKKNEKNNAVKRAFFLTKKPEIEKTEKSKKN